MLTVECDNTLNPNFLLYTLLLNHAKGVASFLNLSTSQLLNTTLYTLHTTHYTLHSTLNFQAILKTDTFTLSQNSKNWFSKQEL